MVRLGCLFAAVVILFGAAIAPAGLPDGLADGEFRWTTGGSVVKARAIGGNDWLAIKDPSVVRHEGRWHLFCTVRGKPRSHAVVYLSFADWSEAATAEQTILPMHEGYFCAPQVFYFAPHKKWYLICQAAREDWEPNYQPAFATTETLGDPASWSKLTPLFDAKPENVRAWLDFWVICDDEAAYLFFTSLDGKMWRSRTPKDRFPQGWSRPEVALTGDIFEASHTYRLGESGRYLTLVEAQNGHGWRYFKAYTARSLDGRWESLAATKDHAFASMRNVAQPGGRWTDAISHGELLRAANDEFLRVDPRRLEFLYQGVADADRQGKGYGDIPWQLGLLRPAAGPAE
jgi:hypothetical protein